MGPTGPNKNIVRRVVNRSGVNNFIPTKKSVNANAVQQAQPVQQVERNWSFNQQEYNSKKLFSFNAACCGGSKVINFNAPIKLFFDAVASGADKTNFYRNQILKEYRAIIPTQTDSHKLSSSKIVEYGQMLRNQGIIPFNPFQPRDSLARTQDQADYSTYVQEYKNFVAPPKNVEASGDANVQAVQKIAENTANKAVEQPESKHSGKPAVKKIAWRKMVQDIDGCPVRAKEYLDFEKTQEKPRSSVIDRLQKIIDKG